MRVVLAVVGLLAGGVAAGFWIDPESDPAWIAAAAPTVLSVACLAAAVRR